jgi:hypothetical protein
MSDHEPLPFVARLWRRRRHTSPVSVGHTSSGEPATRPARSRPASASGAASAPAASAPALTRARVLLVARDRRYRAVASTLLSRRGNTVLDCHWGEGVAEVAVRERIDVVLFDASGSLTATARDAARLAVLDPPIGIVAVSEETQPGLATLPVLPKWTAFEEVFAAIERACSPCTKDGVASGAW